MQAPFWGPNLRMAGVEHLLQPPPVGHPNTNIMCVLDTREVLTLRMAREKREWAARPLWARIWFSDTKSLRRTDDGYREQPESRIRRFVRTRSYRVKRAFLALLNRFVCTKCWHLKKRHWEARMETCPGDYEVIDWICKVHGCKC